MAEEPSAPVMTQLVTPHRSVGTRPTRVRQSSRVEHQGQGHKRKPQEPGEDRK